MVFDDEYLHQMMELFVNAFMGWMQLQVAGDRMIRTFGLVMTVVQGQYAQDRWEVYQAAYDGASWLSSEAIEHGFDEMAAVLDAAAARFAAVLAQSVS